ncbi:MAG TPA: class I SAM-dependent methyltransferase [Bryobacteraceae bacterium]|nr:class I SAM-dependent methyltransferase [Bryobacteraceae bacterium]
MQVALRADYSTVTEQPEQRATRLQMAMLRTRYAWAAGQASNKDVAEIACGAGLGLGWLARMARSVEAGDLNGANCRIAQETYAGRGDISVRSLDALNLPFADASRDLVLLFEAIYYLPDAGAFLDEARRVLRPGGTLLLATVNREWSGFHPSPFHTRYFSAAEMAQALKEKRFSVKLFAGFPERHGAVDAAVRHVRRAAVALKMIPNTMAGKAFLKRLFYGSLEVIPRELAPGGPAEPLYPVNSQMDLSTYRTLYAEATNTR